MRSGKGERGDPNRFSTTSFCQRKIWIRLVPAGKKVENHCRSLPGLAAKVCSVGQRCVLEKVGEEIRIVLPHIILPKKDFQSG